MIELIPYLRLVRRWLWLVIACPLAASAAAWAVSVFTPTVYESHEHLLVRPAQLFGVDAAGSASLSSDQIVQTYAQLMTEPPLLNRVIADLHLNASHDQLGRQLTVTQIPGTTILDVVARDGDAVQARDIAANLVDEFIAEMRQIQPADPTTKPGTRAPDNLIIVAPATLPASPTSPSPKRTIAAAFVGGLLAAVAFLAALRFLDRSIKTDDDVAQVEGLVPLGHLPFTEVGRERRAELIAVNSAEPAAEAYRSLRTNILFGAVDREIKTILITSAMPAEGKSRTAANLAIVLAQAGHRTVLVDADLRHPAQHRLFGRVTNIGLTNLLLQDRPEADLVMPVDEIPNLWLVSSGIRPPNPSELLGGARMREVLERLRQAFGFVVIDTPPVNVVTDPTVLARQTDSTIIVVEQSRTTVPALKQATHSLQVVGAAAIGVVINKQRDGESRYYGYAEKPARAKRVAHVRQLRHVESAPRPVRTIDTGSPTR